MVEEYHVRKLIFLMHEPCEPVVRYAVGRRYAMPHMPATGVSGVDLYTYDRNGREIYLAGKYQFKDTVTYTYAPIYREKKPKFHRYTLYLPLFDKVDALEIGLDENASLKAIENPFRHNIIVHGSSITRGASASRPGMTYAARFGRDNGLYTLNLGFSGMCKLQKEYAHYLADIKDVDAFIFDTFSNPQADVIFANFGEFMDIIRAVHPEVPIIFLQTERREIRNFNVKAEEREAAKQAAAAKVFNERKNILPPQTVLIRPTSVSPTCSKSSPQKSRKFLKNICKNIGGYAPSVRQYHVWVDCAHA